MMTDPVGDMITRIRNAARVRHAEARCPASKLKHAVANVLADEGFIQAVREDTEDGKPVLVLELRYDDSGHTIIDGLKRVSKPGRRVYVGAGELPLVRKGLGMAIISTSKGVMCDREARAQHVGGEVLCEVW